MLLLFVFSFSHIISVCDKSRWIKK